MLSSEAVDIGLFDGVMGSNVTEFQTELKEFISQVDGPKLIEPQAFLSHRSNIYTVRRTAFYTLM